MDYKLPETFQDGAVLHIDKALTWTSFDVVNKVRKSLRTHLGIKKIKVGHAGTLDPLATGLVIICTGKATKQIMQYQDMDKAYIAQIRLGATTPSFDLETDIDQTYSWKHISKEEIEKALVNLSGDQEQLPPLYSAKSVDGKRAYTMAMVETTLEFWTEALQELPRRNGKVISKRRGQQILQGFVNANMFGRIKIGPRNWVIIVGYYKQGPTGKYFKKPMATKKHCAHKLAKFAF